MAIIDERENADEAMQRHKSSNRFGTGNLGFAGTPAHCD